MLVYTRIPSHTLPGVGRPCASKSASNNITVPVNAQAVPLPPSHALKAVHAFNFARDEACKAYTKRYHHPSVSLGALLSRVP